MRRVVGSIVVALAACGSGAPDPNKLVAGPFLPALDPAVRCPDLDVCQKACDADDLRACEDLGTRYANGAGVPVQPTKGAVLYEHACEKGRPSACAALGLLYEDGRGVGESDERAAKLYDMACRSGAGVGCFNLALMMGGGPLPYDRGRINALMHDAEPLYRKACDAGELGWCINLGILYETGMVGPPRPHAAAALYHDACYGGHADACVNLGLMMHGKPGGDDLAARLFTHACDAGSAIGCRALGQSYYQGEGVPADPVRALALLRTGCDGGDANACGVLGAVLALGEKGVTRDDKASRDAEGRACAMGSATACMALAEDAVGEHDDRSAAVAFERACAIGNGEGCWMLATMLQQNRAAPGPSAADAVAREACRLHTHAGCIVLLARGEEAPVTPEELPALRKEGCDAGVKQLCAPPPSP